MLPILIFAQIRRVLCTLSFFFPDACPALDVSLGDSLGREAAWCWTTFGMVGVGPGPCHTPDIRPYTTRQSLKVDPRGPAISNLLHPYLLLQRTGRAPVTKTENGHKTGRQGTDFDDNL